MTPRAYGNQRRLFDAMLAESGGEMTFDAVVGKCTSYGLFVDLPDLAIGGMVHVSKLSQTFVRWDSFREALTDGRQTWQVGTKMKVRVEAVDFAQRKIDFEPAGQVPTERRPPERPLRGERRFAKIPKTNCPKGRGKKRNRK